MRFRKSISLGKGARINIGKKGIGMSVGVKGARVGISSSKGSYVSGGIPGTGLYSISYAKGGKADISKSISPGESSATGTGCVIVSFLIATFIIITVEPILGISMAAIGAASIIIWSNSPKQKIKRKLNEARSLLKSEKINDAMSILQEVIQKDETHIEAIYLAGGALNNFGKHKEAIEYLMKFLELQPENLEVQLLLANCHYRTKDYDLAIKILQKIPQECEGYLKVLSLLAGCFHDMEKYDLAIEVLKKAPLLKRKLDDDLKEIHYNLASVYEEKDDKKSALKHFKKIYAVDVDYRDIGEKIEELERK